MPKSFKIIVCSYLRIDSNSINIYFNPYGRAHLEKRPHGLEFRNYLDSNAGSKTKIDFKVFCCDTGTMRFMVDHKAGNFCMHGEKLAMMHRNDYMQD